MNIIKKIQDIFCNQQNINTSRIKEIVVKKKELEERFNDISCLFLGSSHGAYMINPAYMKSGIFNLCSTSQDLYYSYNLYKKLSHKLTNLQTIVLVYSVFSSGFEVQKTSEKEICAYFKLLYEIDYKYPLDTELKSYVKRGKQFLRKSIINNNCSWGFTSPEWFFLQPQDVSLRVMGHLRECQRVNDQFSYLAKLLELCKKNNHEVIIVIPPAREDYRSFISSKNIFEKLYEQTEYYNIKVINLFASDIFNFDDFGDSDHLNSKGSIKISLLLDQDVRL